MAVINASGANAVCADILTQAKNEFTLSYNNPALDTTALSPTVYSRSYVGGLRDWSATVRSRLEPAQIGSTAIISNAAGVYNANTKKWSLTIDNNLNDVTAFNATAPTSRSFANGIMAVSGNYEGFVDDTTALVAPGPSVNSAVVFRYFDAATDHSLTFGLLITGISAPFTPGTAPLAVHSFVASGNLTHAGSGTLTAPLFPAAMLSSTTVILPPAASAVFTAASGRTYTGNVLLERMTIDVAVDELVTLEYQLKGTGDLTIA